MATGRHCAGQKFRRTARVMEACDFETKPSHSALSQMTSFSRRVLSPLLLVLAAASLRADEVQQLPAMSINGSAGTHSLQPSVVAPVITADASSGFAEAARYTAGFSINDAGARGFGQTTTLRGLGNTPFFSDSSSPVYLDDIPLGSAFTFPTDLYDFSSLSIHRGPQAAMQFGLAADGGVIQLVSAPPEPGISGRVNVTAGNYGLLAFGASVQSAPAGGKSDITAGISTSQRDGYIHNSQINQDVDDRESVAGRVRFRYRPVEDLEISVHVLGQRSRDGAQALVPLGGPLYEVQRSKEGESDTDFGAGALTVTRKLDDAALSSTTSYSSWELTPYNNRLDFFGADFDSALTQSQRTFAEELHYNSEPLSGGLFYSNGRTRGSTDRVFGGFPVERSGFTTDTEMIALFGKANFTPAAGWIVTPGLRAERSSKDFVRTETVPTSQVYARSNDWTAFLPSLAVTRRFDATTDLTVTLSRGFKPGGYSAFTSRADLTTFDPQTTWGLEAAFSASPRNTNFSYTARAYAYRVSGYQIERSFAVPAASTDEYLVVNADRARVLGFELESVWRPLRDVTATLAASVARATLNDFTDPFTGASYSGNQAPYVPHGNGGLRVEYHPALGFFAGAGVTWTGTTYYDEQETGMFSQRAYGLLEGQAGYTFSRGSVTVFGRNLGDREYYSSITTGVGHATPGAPMTWGARLDLRW